MSIDSLLIFTASKLIPTTTTSLTTTQKTTTPSQLPTNATTLPNTSPQEVTTTFTSTTPTKQPNTTDVTTEGETTATDTTTANTTDVLHSTSSTGVNNTTHEQVTTTTQSTTQLSTLTSTGNSQPVPPGLLTVVCHLIILHVLRNSHPMYFLQHRSKGCLSLCFPAKGNLILIQQNMTWIDAMTYCREHHNDLVHVTTREIQEEVAEKAKNATSAHVWLGLRYTCKLNFWFWTRATSACYQNWAPEQGPERTYDCGVTGAIEATGRQQWVGLPETVRLNFICSACAGLWSVEGLWPCRWSRTCSLNHSVWRINTVVLVIFILFFTVDLTFMILTIETLSQWTVTDFSSGTMGVLMFTCDVILLPLFKHSCLLYCWAWISLYMEKLVRCGGVHIHSHGQQE